MATWQALSVNCIVFPIHFALWQSNSKEISLLLRTEYVIRFVRGEHMSILAPLLKNFSKTLNFSDTRWLVNISFSLSLAWCIFFFHLPTGDELLIPCILYLHVSTSVDYLLIVGCPFNKIGSPFNRLFNHICLHYALL